jgi:hypothetical protein
MAKALQIAIANYQEHMKDREYPACFPNQKDYDAWAYMEDITVHTLPIRKFACRDCTTKYQTEQKKVGKCFNPQLKLAKFAD